MLGAEIAAVLVVGRASAFGRHHRRAEGMLWCALLAERRAIARLLQAAQHEPADAGCRLLRDDLVDLEDPLRVMVAILVAELVSGLGDRADAAPLAITDLEDLEDQIPRSDVAVVRDRARILVLDERSPFLELSDGHQDPFE